jgi:SAM-dependent methyltransferase
MVVSNWDAYWRNAQSAAAHKDGGPQDEVLQQFWTQFFEEIFTTIKPSPAMLDIACGNGAVPRFALSAVNNLNKDIDLHICGVDESSAALAEMCKRDPSLNGIAASALFLPFSDNSFELLTSQFGMEYAGLDVFAEAAQVIAADGLFAAVMHMRDGGIYKECDSNLQAISGFKNSNILNHFEELFTEVVLRKGESGNKDAIRVADKKFASSVAAAEEILKRWGKGVANETLLRIYTDVGHMYRRLNAYQAEELINWVKVMHDELDSYAGRMSSMLGAALDETQLADAMAKLTEYGFDIRIQDTLTFGRQSIPSAWVSIAQKNRS